MARTSKRGRDSKTGQFIPIKVATKRPSTSTVEKIKVGPTKKQNGK